MKQFLASQTSMMAEVEGNWQAEISTVKERTTHVFNNELLSDVKFIVAASNAEFNPSKKAKMVIPAHKFVLAISSPVFYAMFYGQMAETTDSIELPDCEYESLLEFFRYLYCEEVDLKGSNVMQVCYLAKKYMIPSLVLKCTDYLRDNVEGSNVFSVLLHAQKFEVKDLEDRCWHVIRTQASETVTSDEFVSLDRTLVGTVVKMDKLYVKEVELFKAVDRWASKEIERQGLTPAGNIKRQVIGDEIVKAIRFPLMSLKEFASVVPDCDILTMKEVGDMMKYYCGVLTTPTPFMESSRFGPLLRCTRFKRVGPIDQSNVSKHFHSVTVTTNKTIFLHGLQLFGREGGSYTADVEVAEDIENSSVLIKQSGNYVSEKWADKSYYVFKVLFRQPVCLEKGTAYKITSAVNGLSAFRGVCQKTSFEVDGSGVTFTITNNTYPGNDIPALVFSVY